MQNGRGQQGRHSASLHWMRKLRLIALVSGVYDSVAGAAMLLERPLITRLFDIPAPHPPLYGDLNGIFLLAVGLGYALPYRDPERGRVYLWVMGPFLKGAGALAFLLDHVVRHSAQSVLLLAASDGALALITLWALLQTSER
jgi:hypothetical protein